MDLRVSSPEVSGVLLGTPGVSLDLLDLFLQTEEQGDTTLLSLLMSILKLNLSCGKYWAPALACISKCGGHVLW